MANQPHFSERQREFTFALMLFTFAICRRLSVCRLSSVVCLSVCLLSVCNVRAPYSGD